MNQGLVERSIFHSEEQQIDKMTIDKITIVTMLTDPQTLLPTPMNVTSLTRSISRHASAAAFNSLTPDIVRVSKVASGQHADLISTDPLTAGRTFAALLERMCDNAPLSPEEKAYLPWMSTLRTMVWGLGAWEMEIESPLKSVGNVPHGICDVLLYGGPKSRGVIEVKVISRGSVLSPRGRDLVQVGAYARLLAGKGSFDDIFAAVAYVELETRVVRLFGVSNARELVTTTLELFKAA